MSERSPGAPVPAVPTPPLALLMDFDGVVLASADLKVDAYAQVYSGEDPAVLAQVLAYARTHGGVTRNAKFAYFEREVFRRSDAAADVARLAEAYLQRVYAAVLAAPFVPGAESFLRVAHDKIALHLVSGTPQDELRDIVGQRGLTAYFRSIVGAPTTKRDAFAHILAQGGYGAGQVAALGDALTEYHAAQELGIPFIGVVAPGDANPFPEGVPVVPALETLASVLRLE